jgi:RNA-binding protein NOB1
MAAAATVPYEGEDTNSKDRLLEQERLQEELKQQSLQPISKSGKTYNSFRKYRSLMKPAAPKAANSKPSSVLSPLMTLAKDDDDDTDHNTKTGQSRIIGGGGMMSSDDMKVEDDDGEGWITSHSDISSMKAANGRLDPLKTMPAKDGNALQTNKKIGPPRSQRTACTTTDFAMQNVLLQMGLCVVSVDGMHIKRLKSWVTRCGACYKIHTDSELKPGIKRLFCSHCGSDMMQRIAASVDGTTGRLKLHLSKKYKHNLRGTKYSLPKAGSVRTNLFYLSMCLCVCL